MGLSSSSPAKPDYTKEPWGVKTDPYNVAYAMTYDAKQLSQQLANMQSTVANPKFTPVADSIEEGDSVSVKVYYSDFSKGLGSVYNKLGDYRLSATDPNYVILHGTLSTQNPDEKDVWQVKFDAIKLNDKSSARDRINNQFAFTLNFYRPWFKKSRIVAVHSRVAGVIDSWIDTSKDGAQKLGYCAILLTASAMGYPKDSRTPNLKPAYSRLVEVVINMFELLANLVSRGFLPETYTFDATEARRVAMEDFTPAFETMETLAARDTAMYNELVRISSKPSKSLTDLFLLNFYGAALDRMNGYSPKKYCDVSVETLQSNPDKYGPPGASLCVDGGRYTIPQQGFMKQLDKDVYDTVAKMSRYGLLNSVISLGDLQFANGGFVMSKDQVIQKLTGLGTDIQTLMSKAIDAASKTCYNDSFVVPDYGFPAYLSGRYGADAANNIYAKIDYGLSGGAMKRVCTTTRSAYGSGTKRHCRMVEDRSSRSQSRSYKSSSSGASGASESRDSPDYYREERTDVPAFKIMKYLAQAAGKLGIMKELIGFLAPADRTADDVVSIYNDAVDNVNEIIRVAKTKMLYNLTDANIDEKLDIIEGGGDAAAAADDAAVQALIARNNQVRDELDRLSDALSQLPPNPSLVTPSVTARFMDLMVKFHAKYEAMMTLYLMIPLSYRARASVKQPPDYPDALLDQLSSAVVDSCVNDGLNTKTQSVSTDMQSFRAALLAQPNAFSAASDV